MEEEEEADSPAFDASGALQESPHTSTQKHTSPRVPPRGRVSHSSSRERPKRLKTQTEPRRARSQSSQESTNSNQTRPVTGAILDWVQSRGEKNPSQDRGPQDSEMGDTRDGAQGSRLRTGPSPSDPPDRSKALSDPEPELDSASAVEEEEEEAEAEDGLTKTSLQHSEDQQQQPLCSTIHQRRSTTRRKSSRTTERL